MHSTPVRNFPNATRPGICPCWRWNAASVCGTPLPTASGKNRTSKKPVPKLIKLGTSRKRRTEGDTPNSRTVVALIARVNSTAHKAASTPTTIVRTRKIRSSLRRSHVASDETERFIAEHHASGQSGSRLHLARKVPHMYRWLLAQCDRQDREQIS